MFPSICPKFISKFMCKIKNSLLFLYLSRNNNTVYSSTEKKNWEMKNRIFLSSLYHQFNWYSEQSILSLISLCLQTMFKATSKVTFPNSNSINPFPKFETFKHKFVATTTILQSTSGCPSPSFASQSRIHIP